METDTPRRATETARRPRKTKLEKIAELEAEVKLTKEENLLYKKELHILKSADRQVGRKSSKHIDLGDIDKIKNALKSLKRVTIKQESSLQAMRSKANDRRRQLETKDKTIGSLQNELRSMAASMKSMERGKPDRRVQQRIRALEKESFEQESANAELRDQLVESESRVRQLERNPKSGRIDPFNFSPSQNRNSSSSVHSGMSLQSSSMHSVSTQSELDLAKMKQELAKKSSRIVSLEYELETVKDQLVEMKRLAQNDGSFQGHESMNASFNASFNVMGEDGFPMAPPMGSDPFKTDPFTALEDKYFSDEEESESGY
jgi:hypothetical protein